MLLVLLIYRHCWNWSVASCDQMRLNSVSATWIAKSMKFSHPIFDMFDSKRNVYKVINVFHFKLTLEWNISALRVSDTKDFGSMPNFRKLSALTGQRITGSNARSICEATTGINNTFVCVRVRVLVRLCKNIHLLLLALFLSNRKG